MCSTSSSSCSPLDRFSLGPFTPNDEKAVEASVMFPSPLSTRKTPSLPMIYRSPPSLPRLETKFFPELTSPVYPRISRNPYKHGRHQVASPAHEPSRMTLGPRFDLENPPLHHTGQPTACPLRPKLPIHPYAIPRQSVRHQSAGSVQPHFSLARELHLASCGISPSDFKAPRKRGEVAIA